MVLGNATQLKIHEEKYIQYDEKIYWHFYTILLNLIIIVIRFLIWLKPKKPKTAWSV